jgi:hypothetical protein
VTINLLALIMTDRGEMFYETKRVIFLTVVARYEDIFRHRYVTGFAFSMIGFRASSC